MNLVTNGLLYTGSGSTSRRSATRRLGIIVSASRCQMSGVSLALDIRHPTPDTWHLVLFGARLRSLGAVFRSSLLAISHADRIQCSPNHVIPHTGKILHATPTDEHNRVLLQVMSNTRDVRRYLNSVRKTHSRDLSKRRVRLLRSLCIDARAHPPLLR